ncbi:MAG: hypothetical protein M3219_02795 [Thermoproteota archaeon]|nr:hypothetical protein [Thermoproteota archaeon]
MTIVDMTSCSIHTEFFDDLCPGCKEEYCELKGIVRETSGKQDITDECKSKLDKNSNRSYKEFTEERAKRLYGELFVQYLKKSYKEEEAAERARAIIRKQCSLRRIPFWSWIN